jgi:tetratricopeptide (TPR) repeat protein
MTKTLLVSAAIVTLYISALTIPAHADHCLKPDYHAVIIDAMSAVKRGEKPCPNWKKALAAATLIKERRLRKDCYHGKLSGMASLVASGTEQETNIRQVTQLYCEFADCIEATESGDTAIDACTRAINLGTFSGERLYHLHISRCWARAAVGRDLEQAVADCSTSLRLKPNDIDALDNRGFVYLRLNRLDDAIADYNAALKIDPKRADPLYGRGLAKLLKGDSAAGNADIAAAKKIKANVADDFTKYGIKPDTVVAPPAPPAPASAPTANCARAETHWKSAEEIKTLAVYEDHLARFPNCDFAALAKARIEALK